MNDQGRGFEPGTMLEVIADMVVLLHRELAYDPLIEESSMVECHVAKNSHGPCTHPSNSIRLVFAPAFGRFAELP